MSSIWVESYQRDLAGASLEFLFGHLGAFVVCSFATLVSRNPGFEGAHLDLIIAGMFSTQALPKRYHCSLPTWLIPMIIGTTPWNIASRQLAATQPPAPWLIGTPKWG